MAERTTPFRLDQIGTGTARFPSGVPVPSATDAAVDPYAKTRTPKEHQVEGILFWPQEKSQFPGIVLLHETWGLTAQIKNAANRLACEGYMVLVPNLYGRLGGMVTANAEVAEALAAKTKESELLQDINSCCEFLNSRDHVKRNIHGVVGFGMGASLAIRFACQRKRLRSAVAFYGPVKTPADVLKGLFCPLLYHRAGADAAVSDADIALLQQAGSDSGRRVDIRSYPGAPSGFCNDMRPDVYRPELAAEAWETTVSFLADCFKDAR